MYELSFNKIMCDKELLNYLCNFDFQNISTDNDFIKKVWSSDWSINAESIRKEILCNELETERIHLLKKYDKCKESILQLGIKSLLTFCNQNWNPHPPELNLENYLHMNWPDNVNAAERLQRDSEPLYINILYPELLYLSHQMFSMLMSMEPNLLHLWWCFRAKVIHQRAIEDNSATIYAELELIMAKLSNELLNLSDKPRLQILLCLELAQAYLIYGRIQNVEEYLVKAKEIAGIKLELTGVLGKRTKYQQQTLPQLALTTELHGDIERQSAEESHGNSALPPDVELEDDVRLNKIQYLENIKQIELPSLEQTLCLLTVQYIQKSQPKDDLMTEELQPYIEAILSQKRGPWSTRVAALLIRCRLEATHKRTVERAMLQCETIVNDKTGVNPADRLSYLWASGVPPAWTWRQQLGDLCLSLGLVKAALEHFLELKLWEDVIVCYTMLQLRHKAAEVIQQQIDINPTVKLFCLLGDATDNESCYEKAWEFSGHKSSRAQRHWGNYLFDRKQYELCIPHYQKCVEINSLQESVWLRLGYAALTMEQWDQAAVAYRRYTYLQPQSFEAWNNLAKVYVHQRDTRRAHRALSEALRYNYDNAKLWENMVNVSMETGHFEDVIRGCHRLLDIKKQFDDVIMLGLLVRAVLEDKLDADNNGASRLRKRVLELFGHVTAVVQNNPEIWQLFSDLSPTYLLKAQRLLKAYRGYTQNGNWASSPETCKQVIVLGQSLLQLSMKARQESEEKDILQCNQQLSSARLTGQAVLRAAQKQDWPDTNDMIQELESLLNNVTDYIKSNM